MLRLPLFAIAALVLTASAQAQQVNGEPGSPHATTTTGGKNLPLPDPAFGGEIKQKASESKPWWAPRVVPPKGAPNVLLIMTDDCGFGAPSTFGGIIPTPALDRVAKVVLHAVLSLLLVCSCMAKTNTRDNPGHSITT